MRKSTNPRSVDVARPVHRPVARRVANSMVGVAAVLSLATGNLGTRRLMPVEPAVADVASVVPVVDVAAPYFWDHDRNSRAGGRAYRFELNDPTRSADISAWYWLAYTFGGDRLQVYEHNPATTHGPDSLIGKSENVAWHAATSVLGHTSGIAQPGEIPDWARPRTGNANGTSAGLLYTLADIDLLTPGPLAENLRIAATGTIASDGTITAVRLVDAKLAAARLIHPDVFFAPTIPPDAGEITTVVSHQGQLTTDRTIGDWLNTAGYEQAGRIAATHPDTLALVAVHDVRQALAWLCGRTQQPATCTVAHTAAATPITTARPYTPTATSPQPPRTPKNAAGPQ